VVFCAPGRIHFFGMLHGVGAAAADRVAAAFRVRTRTAGTKRRTFALLQLRRLDAKRLIAVCGQEGRRWTKPRGHELVKGGAALLGLLLRLRSSRGAAPPFSEFHDTRRVGGRRSGWLLLLLLLL